MPNTAARSIRSTAAFAVASLMLALSACGTSSGQAEPAGLVSASEGASDRAKIDAALATDNAAVGADAMMECGVDLYTPTEEEIAAANAEQEGLASTFDVYGVAYERSVDDMGFVSVSYDWNDAVAQAVAESYWADRYQPEPLPAEEVARIRAENDQLVAVLDAAGVSYTRQTDRWGSEWVEWDYDNPKAQEAVDAFYAELYPVAPISEEELAAMKEENDRVAAAFDAAGIAYTRASDEAGWEWLDWDYEDPDVVAAVDAVYAELYPIDPSIDEGYPCPMLDDQVMVDRAPVDAGSGSGEVAPEPATAPDAETRPAETVPGETVPGETVPGEALAAESDIIVEPVDGGLTEEQAAQRTSDIAALSAGFDAAQVEYWVVGDGEWTSLTFDIANPASVPVVQGVLALRAG